MAAQFDYPGLHLLLPAGSTYSGLTVTLQLFSSNESKGQQISSKKHSLGSGRFLPRSHENHCFLIRCMLILCGGLELYEHVGLLLELASATKRPGRSEYTLWSQRAGKRFAATKNLPKPLQRSTPKRQGEPARRFRRRCWPCSSLVTARAG